MTLCNIKQIADKKKGKITVKPIKIIKFEEKPFVPNIYFVKSYLNFGIDSNVVLHGLDKKIITDRISYLCT